MDKVFETEQQMMNRISEGRPTATSREFLSSQRPNDAYGRPLYMRQAYIGPLTQLVNLGDPIDESWPFFTMDELRQRRIDAEHGDTE